MRAVACLLLVAAFAAAAADNDDDAVHLGTTDFNILQETKICYYGKSCAFRANTAVHLAEKADQADGSITKSSSDLKFALNFDVTSQCGTKTSQFYRVDVTHFYGGKDSDKASAVVKRFPVYFTVDSATGRVHHVYTSRREKSALARMKIGLVRTLARHISSEALHRMNNANTVNYVFEGDDTNGHYVSEHKLQRDHSGELQLLESLDYQQSYKHASHSTLRLGGKAMHLQQSRKTKTTLLANGRVSRIHSKDTLSVGEARMLQSMTAHATTSVASTGRTSFKVTLDLERGNTTASTAACHKSLSLADFEADVEDVLGGSVKKKLDDVAPLGADVAEDELDPAETLLEAEDVMAAGKFTVHDIAPLMSHGTAKLVTQHALQLFQQGSLDLESLKTVFGALASAHDPDAYDQLVSVMLDTTAHPELRQQAMVSLIPLDNESPPPAYVVNSVAELAHSPTDPMAPQATLLLGSLLQSRPASDLDATKERDNLVHQLDALNPTADASSDRALTLLGAVGNARLSAAAAKVVRFLDHPNAGVRAAAVASLKSIRLAGSASSFVDSSSEGDNDLDFVNDLEMTEDDEDVHAMSVLTQAHDAAGHRQEFPAHAWNVAGNDNFAIQARTKSGATLGHGIAKMHGTSSLAARIFHYRRPMVETSYSGDFSGSKGSLDVTLSLVGHTIGGTKLHLKATDVAPGNNNACPAAPSSAGSSKFKPVKYHRTFFRFKANLLMGPVPVVVDIAAAGSLGYQTILEGTAGCTVEGKTSSSLFAGVAPTGHLDVRTEMAVDAFVASAGVSGRMALVAGRLPTYTEVTSRQACAKINEVQSALTADVGIYATFGAKRWDKPLVKFQGLPHNKFLFHSCKAAPIGTLLTSDASSKNGQSAQANIETATTGSSLPLGRDAAPAPVSRRRLLALDQERAETVAGHEADLLLADLEFGNLGVSFDGVDVSNSVPSGVHASLRAANLAEATAHQAIHEVHQEGMRNRNTISAEGMRTRATSRSGGVRARSQARAAGVAVDQDVQQQGQATRQAERSQGEQARGTVRGAAGRVSAAVEEQGHEQRALSRREEGREEAAVESSDESNQRRMAALQQEMGDIEKNEEVQSLKKMFRRKMAEVEDKDASLEKDIERKNDRDRFRRNDKKEKQRMNGIKGMLQRRKMRAAERRGVERLGDMTRRNFKQQRSKERAAKMRGVMRREADLKGKEQAAFGEVKDKMNENEAEERERRRLQRVGKEAEQAQATKDNIRRKMASVDQAVKQEGQAERAQQQREKQAVEGKLERGAEQAQESREAESLRHQERRQEKRQESRSRDRRLRKGMRGQARRGRRQMRGQGRRSRTKMSQAFAKAMSQRGMEGLRDLGRRLQGRGADALRHAAKNLRGTARAGFERAAQQAASGDLEGALRSAAETARGAGRSAMKALRRGVMSQAKLIGRAGARSRHTARAGASSMRRAQNRNTATMQRRLSRQEEQSQDNAKQMSKERSRQRRDTRRVVKREEDQEKANRRQQRRRFKRTAARTNRRFKKSSAHANRRINRASQRNEEDQTQYANQMLRKQARRSLRTRDRFSRKSARNSKRFAKSSRHWRRRMDRSNKRRVRRSTKDYRHWQRRIARESGRQAASLSKAQGSLERRASREEMRSAEQVSATNAAFGLREGRSEQSQLSLVKSGAPGDIELSEDYDPSDRYDADAQGENDEGENDEDEDEDEDEDVTGPGEEDVEEDATYVPAGAQFSPEDSETARDGNHEEFNEPEDGRFVFQTDVAEREDDRESDDRDYDDHQDDERDYYGGSQDDDRDYDDRQEYDEEPREEINQLDVGFGGVDEFQDEPSEPGARYDLDDEDEAELE